MIALGDDVLCIIQACSAQNDHFGIMQCLLRRSSYKWWFVLRGLARVSASCISNFQASVCVLNNEAEEVKICKGMVLSCTSCNRQCTSCKKQCKSCKEAPVQVVQEVFKLVFVC